jgi:hypothetical protein
MFNNLSSRGRHPLIPPEAETYLLANKLRYAPCTILYGIFEPDSNPVWNDDPLAALLL